MLRSPQSLPPPATVDSFLMEPPPHALSASVDMVASAASTACVRLTLISCLPVLRTLCRGSGDGSSAEGAHHELLAFEDPVPLGRWVLRRTPSAVRRDPVEHDAEQHDGDAGG